MLFQAAFSFKHAICCCALGITNCDCTGSASQPWRNTEFCCLCSLQWYLRASRAMCQGFPSRNHILLLFWGLPQLLVMSVICRRRKTGFSARWGWDQLLSCSSEQLQKWFPSPPGTNTRDLIPLYRLWCCEIGCTVAKGEFAFPSHQLQAEVPGQ